MSNVDSDLAIGSELVEWEDFNSEISVALPGVATKDPVSRKFDLSTPEGWRDKLLADLAARQSGLQLFDDYYTGKHRLQFATVKFRTAFGLTFRQFADNWCPLVIDSVDERLNVEGFRFGTPEKPIPDNVDGDAADDVITGDDLAWDIWQENQLDAYSQIAHTESLIAGESYALITPAGPNTIPFITIEAASQTIVQWAPGTRRHRLAALKSWTEDDGTRMCTLYMPDWVFKWKGVGPGSGTPRWTERTPVGETWPLENTLGVVPVVPLVNRTRLLGGGRSEIADVVPLQDAVNKTLMDMLVASEFGAYKQRWVTGIDIPTDPVTGEQVEAFKTAVDRLFHAEDPNAKFGEFTQTDLGNFVKAVEMLVQHIASQSRTPPHYFYLSGHFPSGESIKAAESSLVAKVRRKMRHFGEAWEEVIRLSCKAMGDTQRAANTRAEVIWGDPESRTESQHVDATVKLKALGIPDEVLWERLGMTPTEIVRIKAIRTKDLADRMGAMEMTYEETRNRSTAAAALVRAGFDPAAVLEQVGLPPLPYSGRPSSATANLNAATGDGSPQ